MKTTGVLPEALAASISRFSRSDAMPNSLPSGESQADVTEAVMQLLVVPLESLPAGEVPGASPTLVQAKNSRLGRWG
jgi:hypothetical protein